MAFRDVLRICTKLFLDTPDPDWEAHGGSPVSTANLSYRSDLSRHNGGGSVPYQRNATAMINNFSTCFVPGELSEADWLALFDGLRIQLGQALATEVQLGEYWIEDRLGHASGGGACSVRGRAPLADVVSDAWEGRLCCDGNRGKPLNADIFLFPFLDGSPVTRRGRLADRPLESETDEFVFYHFDGQAFVSTGWHYPDGAGEWAEVTSAGAIYKQSLRVEAPLRIRVGEPLEVRLEVPHLSMLRALPHPSAVRISLVHANRGRERTNLVPWTAQPLAAPREGQVLTLKDCSFAEEGMVRLRLDAFSIRGGWTPGKYHITLRVQNAHRPDENSWTSEISPAFKIELY